MLTMASFRAALSRKPAAAASLLSSEAIGARLDELERKIDRLRALYESFFLGVERRPPHVPRQELNRLMLETHQVVIRNAALRFRYQSVAQRWTLLTTYWNRTLREIESGTYRRDLQKAYRHLAARGEPMTEEEAATLGIPVGRAKAFVAQQNRRWGRAGPDQQATAPTTTVAAPKKDANTVAAPAVLPTNVAPESLDLASLQQAYADAQGRLGLAGPPPSADRLRAKLIPYLQRLRAAHPAAPLEIHVVAEGGRLVVRAKPTS